MDGPVHYFPPTTGPEASVTRQQMLQFNVIDQVVDPDL
jgi:hypothetical protein